MQIIDTHQHLWNLEKLPYSWCASIPTLNRSFLLDDYRQATGEAGVEILASVHVEADIDEPFMLDETRWISELAAQPDSPIRGIVAAARPEHEDFPELLEQLREFSLVKGVRRILHTGPTERFTTPLFAENLRRLPERGLSFDLCVRADQLPDALRLVQACPETQFILDHCGNPLWTGDLTAWRTDMVALAACPNIAGKVSGIVVNGEGGQWTTEELRPCVEHVLEVFGPDRVMWGSDWPVCTLAASYGQWLEAAEALTAQLDAEARHKLFIENAKRIYRLELD
jgi:L-fuconolactonase